MSSSRLLARGPARLAVQAIVIALALAACALVSAGSADAATSSRGPAPRLSSYDARLLHDINAARVAHGRARLVATAGTTDVAHRWSCHMGKWTTLSHRPNLVTAISTHGSGAWHVLGEN